MLAFDKVLHTIFFGQLLVSLVSDLKESLARFLKLVVKPSPEDRCLYLFQTYEINLFSSLQIFFRGFVSTHTFRSKNNRKICYHTSKSAWSRSKSVRISRISWNSEHSIVAGIGQYPYFWAPRNIKFGPIEVSWQIRN